MSSASDVSETSETADPAPDPDRVRRYRERVFGERSRLIAAFPEARRTQQGVLEDLLRFNADTEFGRAHGFGGIRDLADLRRAMPIHDYAALAPFIERAAAGERNVLTADDPVLYFTSSGSTGDH